MKKERPGGLVHERGSGEGGLRGGEHAADRGRTEKNENRGRLHFWVGWAAPLTQQDTLVEDMPAPIRDVEAAQGASGAAG